MFKGKIKSMAVAMALLGMVSASLLPALTAFADSVAKPGDLIFKRDATGNVVAIVSKNGLVTPIGDVLVIKNASGVPTGIKTIDGAAIAVGSASTIPAQSSAGATVVLDTTWFNTATPNILSSASAVTVSFPTAASVPAAVGTAVYLQQEGGDVTVSGVTSAVTLNAEGGKKTTNGLHAIMGCIYRGTDVWDCFGNRK